MAEQLLSVGDLRGQLSCSTSTIYRWIEKGLFPKPIKIGGMARWRKADYDKFVETAIKLRDGTRLRPPGHRPGRPPYSGKPGGKPKKT